jgi:hypothetical protein
MEVHRKIMKKFSIIHIPVLSFFSKELYIDVGQNWKGVNFLYLLLLLAVCLIPTMINLHRGISNFVNNEAPAIVNQVPEITITDGQVSIKETQPYYIKDPDSDEPLAIIDTTGQIESLEDTDAFFLLTGNKVIIKESKFENRTYDLSNVKAFAVDSERITGWLGIGRKFLTVVIYPFALLGSYLFRIVQALIYAAIGLLFALWCKITLSYATLLRLAVVAMTPCLLAKTIFGLADIHLPYATLIFLVITLAYLFFAVKANSEIILIQEEAKDPEEMII